MTAKRMLLALRFVMDMLAVHYVQKYAYMLAAYYLRVPDDDHLYFFGAC